MHTDLLNRHGCNRSTGRYTSIAALLMLLVGLLLSTHSLASEATASHDNNHNIRVFLRNWLSPNGQIPHDLGPLYVTDTLRQLYQQHQFEPIWFGPNGLRPDAAELLNALTMAEEEGLEMLSYHQLGIQWRNLRGSHNALLQAEQELLLSDAFFGIAQHLYSGLFKPEQMDSSWHIKAPQLDVESLLTALRQGHPIAELLQALTPPHSGYRALRSALARYQRIQRAGGWPSIDAGPTLKVGDRDSRLSALSERLLISGDMAIHPDLGLYDEALSQGVKNFQLRHGLEPHGELDKQTVTALNVPLKERINQIRLNMVRWRWLPRELGKKHIFVNTVSFELNLIDNYRPALNMKAIVGKPYRSTPAFSEELTYMVINPSWYIPPNILKKDILPKVRKNPFYLSRKNIHVQRVRNDKVEEVPLDQVDWDQFYSGRYRLRQTPGEHNALGRIKFMMPNQFGIYLHDTPSRELFNKTVRTFSSGCIRLEKPVKLASYLLQSEGKWNEARLQQVLDSGQTQWVKLDEPFPVYLTYFTTWVDRSGQAHFRDDIYGRDQQLSSQLFGEPDSRNNI